MHTVKWFVAVASLLVAAIVTAVSLQSSAAADAYGGERWPGAPGFSNRTIKGQWGFSSSLGMLVPPAVAEPIAATSLGRISFDGNGGCSISLWSNINGQTSSAQSSTCSYSVNADGTGTNEATFPNTPFTDPIPIVFVIVDEGREIRLMSTQFIVSTISARRQ